MTSKARRLAVMVVLSCGVPVLASVGRAQTQTAPPTSQNPPTTQNPPATQNPPVPKPFPGSNPNSGTTAKPTPPPPAQTPDQARTPTPPATRPQPSAQTQTPRPVTPPAPMPAGAPTEAALGVKFFPGAEYLESFDAGRGQRLYLFGTNATFAEVVAFYKNELKTGGSELFREPPMQQFDLPGTKFQKDLMSYPPSVVVKDYTWAGVTGDLKAGYAFVDGTTEKRFNTVIQVVPAPPATGGK